MSSTRTFPAILLGILLLALLAACGSEPNTTPVVAPSAPTMAIAEALQEDTTDAPARADVAVPAVEAKAAPAVSGDAAPAPALAGLPTFSLSETEQDLIALYERANPGVVHIVTNAGEGSGFVYDTAGHIVTNNHVVEGASRLAVRFADGNEATARLVGADPDSDLAVLQVEVPSARLTAIPIGDSAALRVGQFVVAIGNPFGLQGSMTIGIVSGLGRLLNEGGGYSISDIIQTDAAINPGNSGGPLLNLSGQVVGVNTAIESPVRANSGIGYAVPAATVQRVVPQLIEDGQVAHPWLGLSGGTLDAATIRALGLPEETRGVVVATVIDGGPAASAGLRGATRQVTVDGQVVTVGGDIILAIDGQAVADFDDLLTYIVQRAEVGQQVNLRVLRDGDVRDIPVVLGARP